MSKQLSDAPLKPDEQLASSTTGEMPPTKTRQPAVFWPWFGGLLLVGIVIVVIVTSVVSNWLNNVERGIGASQPSGSVSTVNVQRNAIYNDLAVTLLTMQSAASFSDDPIHAGQSMVRATVRVKNPTTSAIALAYYDDARLLAPGQQPIAPVNLNLSAAPRAGATETGWIDFPLTGKVALDRLKLQFGNASLNEMLVTIPVSGAYNASQYNVHTYHPPLTIVYYFKGWQIPAYDLTYHLTSIDVRDSYNGVETRGGQQFYVLNFTVDNPNGVEVDPGYGTDYVRLALGGGNRPPEDNTLPYGFKANAHGVSGHVAFAAPAGLHNLTIVFLRQAVAGGDPYPVSW